MSHPPTESDGPGDHDLAHWRPQLHYTAADTWLNDPNGLVHDGSRYHVYYQSNPHGTHWGSMSWGHASSADLFTWTEHETALMHTDQEDVFSGSVVVDHTNTSGLGDGVEPPLVALYTSAYTDASPRARIQAQSVAWSTDRGMTWRRSDANPVLDRGSADFRDPKVFRYVPPAGQWADGWWVMAAVEAADHQVVLYRSDTLHEWELLSHIGPLGAVGGLWECPDLFPLPVVDPAGAPTGRMRWVLVISIHPGGPNGGSAMQYLIGTFDGATFTPDRHPGALGETLWVDGGRDYYAAVSFDNIPDRRLMVGWVGNWDYCRDVPDAGWRGVLSLPREVDLQETPHGLRLRQRILLPTELLPRETPDRLPDGQSAHRPSGVLLQRFAVPAHPGARTEIVLSSTAGDEFVATVDGTARTIVVDRVRCGSVEVNDLFPPGGGAALVTETKELDVLVIADGCVVTVVAEGGLTVLTHLVFPDAPLSAVRVSH